MNKLLLILCALGTSQIFIDFKNIVIEKNPWLGETPYRNYATVDVKGVRLCV